MQEHEHSMQTCTCKHEHTNTRNFFFCSLENGNTCKNACKKIGESVQKVRWNYFFGCCCSRRTLMADSINRWRLLLWLLNGQVMNHTFHFGRHHWQAGMEFRSRKQHANIHTQSPEKLRKNKFFSEQTDTEIRPSFGGYNLSTVGTTELRKKIDIETSEQAQRYGQVSRRMHWTRLSWWRYVWKSKLYRRNKHRD